MLFQLFKHLEDLSLTSEVSPLYNDYIEKMQNAANGDITNEDIQAFLNTDGNKDLISNVLTVSCVSVSFNSDIK